MPTRNVVLTDHHEDVIDRLVKSGRYQNASEVLREGLRLIEAREQSDALKLQALKKAADAGFSDLESGGFSELGIDEVDDFVNRLGSKVDAEARQQTDH